MLIPAGKPPVVSNQGNSQTGGSQAGDDDAASGELASMSPELKVQKAEQMYQLAKTRYEERFLKAGSLYEAIEYLEKAERYLADISNKPAFYEEMQQMTLQSKETLQTQFNSMRMEAYLLTKKNKYSEARDKLETILKLIPNPDDERHKLAKDKLREIRNK
jgi:hypothetical protein